MQLQRKAWSRSPQEHKWTSQAKYHTPHGTTDTGTSSTLPLVPRLTCSAAYFHRSAAVGGSSAGLKGKRCSCSLQQVQSGNHNFTPQIPWLGGGSSWKDCKTRVDVLMRLGSHDETRLPGLEATVANLRTELDKFLDLEEGSRRNIGVGEEDVPGRPQGSDGFCDKNTAPGAVHVSEASGPGERTLKVVMEVLGEDAR